MERREPGRQSSVEVELDIVAHVQHGAGPLPSASHHRLDPGADKRSTRRPRAHDMGPSGCRTTTRARGSTDSWWSHVDTDHEFHNEFPCGELS